MTRKTTAHEIAQDMNRIRKETGHYPSRDAYLGVPGRPGLGVFRRQAIDEIFGSWAMMKVKIGATYVDGKRTPEAAKRERELRKYDIKSDLFKKFEKEVKPYHGKFDRLGKDIFSVASITDSHSQFWDPFTWHVFLDYCRQAQPDLLVLGGDHLDFYGISRHMQNPQRAMEIQGEIDFVVEKKLRALRAACPRAQIDYHFGNHEARLFAYLCEKSPALSSLRCLQFDRLLSLEDLNINLVGRENFIFKTKAEDNFKVYRGLWAWTHGTDCSVFPAMKELGRHGCSGASGHVHRHTHFSKRDVYGFKNWTTVGASCTLETGHEYIPSLINWEKGFLLTFVHPKNVTQQHISTEGGHAAVGGIFYKAKA